MTSKLKEHENILEFCYNVNWWTVFFIGVTLWLQDLWLGMANHGKCCVDVHHVIDGFLDYMSLIRCWTRCSLWCVLCCVI